MAPTRRDFIGGSIVRLAGLAAVTADRARGGDTRMQHPVFRTRLSTVLGIEYPIIQAPMQSIVTPELVAAVGQAGGIGVLPGIGVPPDDLRRQIRRVRELTDRPFGVNLILHAALRPPVDPSSLPPGLVAEVNETLNRFRARLGLPARTGAPPAVPDTLAASFDVIVDERVPLFSTGLGLPTTAMVQRCHAGGAKVMCMVATLDDARAAAALGADVIAAQGAEAGGHRSAGEKPVTPERAAVGTIVLTREVARALRVPVVAAGGITDGQGIAAALMLGASGALIGTRFIATRESAAPAFHKQALVDAGSDDTTLTDAFTGHYARFLRNTYSEDYRASGAPVLPPVLQQLAARDIFAAAAQHEDASLYPLYAGQGTGLIDHVPPAGEVVRVLVEQARHALASAPAAIDGV